MNIFEHKDKKYQMYLAEVTRCIQTAITTNWPEYRFLSIDLDKGYNRAYVNLVAYGAQNNANNDIQKEMARDISLNIRTRIRARRIPKIEISVFSENVTSQLPNDGFSAQ